MSLTLKTLVLPLLKTLKSTPLKRTSPSSVPIHKYPSLVCWIAWTVFCGKPSSVRHELWTYSLILCERPRAQTTWENQVPVRPRATNTTTKHSFQPAFLLNPAIPQLCLSSGDETLRITQKSPLSFQKETKSRAEEHAKKYTHDKGWPGFLTPLAYNFLNSVEISLHWLSFCDGCGDRGIFVLVGATGTAAPLHSDSPDSAI